MAQVPSPLPGWELVEEGNRDVYRYQTVVSAEFSICIRLLETRSDEESDYRVMVSTRFERDQPHISDYYVGSFLNETAALESADALMREFSRRLYEQSPPLDSQSSQFINEAIDTVTEQQSVWDKIVGLLASLRR